MVAGVLGASGMIAHHYVTLAHSFGIAPVTTLPLIKMAKLVRKPFPAQAQVNARRVTRKPNVRTFLVSSFSYQEILLQ